MKQKFKVRSRSRRGVGYVIAALAVALVLGGGAWVFTVATPAALPTPLLLQSPPSAGAGQEWFGQRLKERFPVASSEADLIRELWLEGFVPRTNLRAERRTAEFESQKDLFRKCRLAASVTWTADDKGQLTAIDGEFSDACP